MSGIEQKLFTPLGLLQAEEVLVPCRRSNLMIMIMMMMMLMIMMTMMMFLGIKW